MAENTSTGDYVKAPEAVPPVEEQLGQLKLAAKGNISEFVDQANQAANDPSNKASDENLKRDVDATAQDAANSYTTTDSHTQSPTLFQSLGNTIYSTAQTVKDAFVTPSPTANSSHATPTTTNIPVTHPPAQSVAESIGQTAAALRDALKSTWSSPGEYPSAQTATPTTKKGLPGGSDTA